jgi:hypothetical protein
MIDSEDRLCIGCMFDQEGWFFERENVWHGLFFSACFSLSLSLSLSRTGPAFSATDNPKQLDRKAYWYLPHLLCFDIFRIFCFLFIFLEGT